MGTPSTAIMADGVVPYQMIGVRRSACMRRIVIRAGSWTRRHRGALAAVFSAAGFVSAFGPVGQLVAGSDCGDLV